LTQSCFEMVPNNPPMIELVLPVKYYLIPEVGKTGKSRKKKNASDRLWVKSADCLQ